MPENTDKNDLLEEKNQNPGKMKQNFYIERK